MKNTILSILLVLTTYAGTTLSAQCTVNRFCLSFANPSVNSPAAQYEFDMVISGDVAFGLGTSNVQFRYNNAALSNPTIVSSVIGAPLYQPPSITTPFIPSLGENVGSLNIELNTIETGQNIPTSGVVIARIRFTITNPSMMSDLIWYYNGGTTQTIIYDDDETTQLCAVSNDNSCLVPLSTVLPLELLSFDLETLDRSFDITWRSQREIDFEGYSLERSSNLSKEFNEIAFVDSKFAASYADYRYEDENVELGVTYYYRLKMMDLDGSYSYSNIISGQLKGEERKIVVFPNPLQAQDELHIQTDITGKSTFFVWNSHSQIVKNIGFEMEAKISIKEFTPGVYYYQFRNNNTTKIGSFTVVK